jgi:hypothetical protein
VPPPDPGSTGHPDPHPDSHSAPCPDPHPDSAPCPDPAAHPDSAPYPGSAPRPDSHADTDPHAGSNAAPDPDPDENPSRASGINAAAGSPVDAAARGRGEPGQANPLPGDGQTGGRGPSRDSGQPRTVRSPAPPAVPAPDRSATAQSGALPRSTQRVPAHPQQADPGGQRRRPDGRGPHPLCRGRGHQVQEAPLILQPPARRGCAPGAATAAPGVRQLGLARFWFASRANNDTQPLATCRIYHHKCAIIKYIDCSAESWAPYWGPTLSTIEIMAGSAAVTGRRRRSERHVHVICDRT